MYELYKKAKTGNIVYWSITVDKNTYYTTTGILDGAKVISDATICQEKNVGKKNYISPNDQALKEALAKYRKKKEEGYVDTVDLANLQDSSKQEVVMLAEEYDDFKDSIGENEIIYVQPKLDGIRSKGDKILVSRKNKQFVAVPHIVNEIANLNCILDGELYNHELKDDFNELTSIVKRLKPDESDLQKSKDIMQYHVYDCIMSKNFSERYDFLKTLFDNNAFQYLKLVPTYAIVKKEIQYYHDLFVEQGYEGIIIRRNKPYDFFRSVNLLKKKDFKDGEFIVVDILEGTGNRSGMFGKFILEDSAGNQFGANALGNYEKYTKMLKDKSLLIGKAVTVRYQNLTPRGVPRFGIVTTIRDYE